MPSILVIDDDVHARGLVRHALQRAGYDVVEACDGDEGSRLARERLPSLVITDIIMPDKEGLEVIRELHQEFHALPIIAMTGGGTRLAPHALLQVATALGACGALAKPFGVRDLLDSVARALDASGRPLH